MGEHQAEDLPDVNLRVALGKILLECGQYDITCNELAAEIFNTVKLENDENVEIWFLMGVALFTMSPPDLEMSRLHLEKAMEMFTKIRESLIQINEPFPYDAQVKQIMDQLQLVKEAEEEEGKNPTNLEIYEDDNDNDNDNDNSDDDNNM